MYDCSIFKVCVKYNVQNIEKSPLSVKSTTSTHSQRKTAISICEYSVLCTGTITVMFALLPWQQTFGAHTSHPELNDWRLVTPYHAHTLHAAHTWRHINTLILRLVTSTLKSVLQQCHRKLQESFLYAVIISTSYAEKTHAWEWWFSCRFPWNLLYVKCKILNHWPTATSFLGFRATVTH